MPNTLHATLSSLSIHTILMSFPRIPNPIEAVYWSICKVLEMIEPKSPPKWQAYKVVDESKTQKDLESARVSSSVEKEKVGK
jgi:hypothetical protein